MLKRICFAVVFAISTAAIASDSSKSQTTNDDAEPATRYNGSAPIDLSRGILFNNGTFGKSNPDYEAQANSGYLAPGIRATPYSYKQQSYFVSKVEALYPIYEEAIQNLKSNKDQREEVKAYREHTLSELQTRLAASKDALKKAGSANESEWPAAQDQARKAFGDLQAILVHNISHY